MENGYFVMVWQIILCNWFAKIGVIPPLYREGGTTHALTHTDNATDPLQKDYSRRTSKWWWGGGGFAPYIQK